VFLFSVAQDRIERPFVSGGSLFLFWVAFTSEVSYFWSIVCRLGSFGLVGFFCSEWLTLSRSSKFCWGVGSSFEELLLLLFLAALSNK